MSKPQVAAAAALALCLAAPARGADDLSRVLRRCVDAYGGAQALKRAVAVRETGHVTSVMRGNAAGALVRTFAPPGRLRVDITYPGGKGEARVLDGAAGWREGEKVEGMQLAAMVLQAARLELPRVFAEAPDRVADAGPVERGGKKLRAVAVDLGNGLSLTAEIDPESGQVLHTTGAGALPGGMRIYFDTDYSDFRKVNGLLFAFKEENLANGVRTGETLLDQVEILPAAPANAFKPGGSASSRI
ncbi:hypothetical protein [Anaeromyxobacter paludicola]|uniref:Outer membrane lipoprotein-sorting protein n=1 Tax=Anaeromyxobacter paludicola TaxID=2918171 RepID=A0ABM7XF94_9BACT|nr:hypothetical protein [Anaeromyxobacter paludicola]BDG10569.1 hypothetical protein AMPC_36820 [Anaeromyxobacter paludicola]